MARVTLLVVIFFSISIYFSNGQDKEEVILYEQKDAYIDNTTDSSGNKQSTLKTDGMTKPKKGLAVTIGKNIKDVKKEYGEPGRIDPSSYGYDWWIYNQDQEKYFQLAVKNEKVVSAYGIGENIDVAPFYIGQPIDEIYSSLSIEMSIDVDTENGAYSFELSEEDMNMRPLIKIGKLYVQLYLDKFTGTVSSIRFLNAETLLKLRPYELPYRGELEVEEILDEEKWKLIEQGNQLQIFDLTNVIRKRFEVNGVQWNEPAAQAAFLHSQDMADNDFFSNTSPTKGDLEQRLTAEQIEYVNAGENIAVNYVDSIAAVEGWLNSKGHRETMLNTEFTDLGVGVYHKLYTQNFISK